MRRPAFDARAHVLSLRPKAMAALDRRVARARRKMGFFDALRLFATTGRFGQKALRQISMRRLGFFAPNVSRRAAPYYSDARRSGDSTPRGADDGERPAGLAARRLATVGRGVRS